MKTLVTRRPGKELDVIVAKNVMKWKDIGEDNVPDFSTDISYAWTIAEYTNLLTKGFLYKEGSDWCIKIKDRIYRDKSAPMVICIAALVELSLSGN